MGRPVSQWGPAAGHLWTAAYAAASCHGESVGSSTEFSSQSSEGDKQKLGLLFFSLSVNISQVTLRTSIRRLGGKGGWKIIPARQHSDKQAIIHTSMGCVSLRWALRSINSWGIQVGTSYGLERIQALNPRTPAWRRTRSTKTRQVGFH